MPPASVAGAAAGSATPRPLRWGRPPPARELPPGRSPLSPPGRSPLSPPGRSRRSTGEIASVSTGEIASVSTGEIASSPPGRSPLSPPGRSPLSPPGRSPPSVLSNWLGSRLGRGGDLGVAGREHVLRQSQLGNVVEAVGAGRRLDRPHREHLSLDPLDRQRQPPALGVDLQDLDAHRVARLDDLPGIVDVVLGELGDVDQTLDAVEDLHERSEGDHLGDAALELVADVVRVDHALPRVLLGLLETQRDPLALTVDVEHLDADGVADGEDLGRVVRRATTTARRCGSGRRSRRGRRTRRSRRCWRSCPPRSGRAAAGRGSARGPPCAAPRARPGVTARRCCGCG